MLNPLFFGIESSVDNLLPELLLALLGHTGGAFTTHNDSSESDTKDKAPKLSDAVDWVTESEREQLNRLVSLGYYFSRLEKFVDECGEHTGTPHIYRNALANGITELLDVYRSAVLEVERRLLQHPPPPLLSIQRFLGDFEMLFPEVLTIVNHASTNYNKNIDDNSNNKSSNSSASSIMTMIQKRSQCGIPVIQACMLRLLWHCNQVLFKQIEGWMLYGKLIDPGKEFFIQEIHSHSNTTTTTHRNTITMSNTNHNTTTMSSLDGIVVVNEALPPGISSLIASKILFIGKATKIIRTSPSTTLLPSISQSSPSSSSIVLSREDFMNISETLWSVGRKEESFRPAEMEHAVESIRKKVAAALWSLMTKQCDIDAQLMLMQDICLMGRADVYQRLSEEGSALFASTPVPHAANDDVHAAFVQAVGQSGYSDKHRVVKQFTLRWFHDDNNNTTDSSNASSSNTSSSKPSWHPSNDTTLYIPKYNNNWDGLCLECYFDWPIGLLFPPEVLQKYCAMWQYVYRIKCVQLDVEHAWSTLMSWNRKERKRSGDHQQNNNILLNTTTTTTTAITSSLNQLRNRISHFINTLALYLRIDVIDASICTLQRCIHSANDFTTADSAHKDFANALISYSCLDIRQLMVAIESIFKITREFCMLIDKIEKKEVSPTIATATTMELTATFVLKQNVVFQLLQSNVIQTGPRGGAVRQFILRLNYNDFCAKEALEQIQMVKEEKGGDDDSGDIIGGDGGIEYDD